MRAGRSAENQGRSLRVVDLFCGPGGLSEGMRQAGFETVFALDYDRMAVESFRANHPEAQVIHDDIRNLDPASLPECDIITGGPPCVNFSTSKGSRGNILDGLELVQAYLRVIHYVKPKWWIMENVPRVTKFLPETIPLSWIGLEEDGVLSIPVRGTFNAAEFGVPQRRKRFLMGNYPVPSPTHTVVGAGELQLNGADSERTPTLTLGDVLNALPHPGSKPKQTHYTDPNYGFSIPLNELTDQFHETWIDPAEVQRLKDVKLNHPYMGKMSFPDNLDAPARTVVATQLGRETLVIEDGGRYRRPTVREVATMQSFPLTYQFFGSASARYRLVGDAVPPLLGYAIGKLIRDEAGLPSSEAPIGGIKASRQATPLPPLPDRTNRRPTNKPDRKFAQMIPGKEVRGCRAELDNRGDSVPEGEIVRWRAMLHVGEGSSRRDMEVTPDVALDALTAFTEVPDLQDRLAKVLDETDALLASAPISSNGLQTAWVETQSEGGPDTLVTKCSQIIDRRFPKEKWSDVRKPAGHALPIVRASGIRLRVAIGLAVAARIAELTRESASEETLSKRWAARKHLSGVVELDALKEENGHLSLFQSGAL